MENIKEKVLNFISMSSPDHTFEELDDMLKSYFKKRLIVSLLIVILGAIASLIMGTFVAFVVSVALSLVMIFIVLQEVQSCYSSIVDSIENNKIKRPYVLLKHESGIFLKVFVSKSFKAKKNYEVTIYADSAYVYEGNDNTLVIANPIVMDITKYAEQENITEEVDE